MNTRIVLLVAGWLAGAAAAATGVTLALSVLGSGLFGTASHPLSVAQVERQLAQAGPVLASPVPSAAPARSPQPAGQGGIPRVKSTSGGSAIVRCTDDGAWLMTIPAQGYRADDLVAGPAPQVSVAFRSDSAEVHVTAVCVAGHPQFTVSSEPRGGH